MSVLKYLSLHSTFFDLGIFLNHFTNIPVDQEWRLVFVHLQPLMLVYSWVNKLLPNGLQDTGILLMQAMALALPVGWIFHRFGNLPALAFALYFPLWYNALFDFHMDHLVVPLLFGFFFMEKSDRIVLAVIFAILLALVKEPFALQTAACGIYLVLGRKHPFAGIALMAFGLSYFYLATSFLIPYFTAIGEVGLYSSGFSWLGNSFGEMVWYLATKLHLVLIGIISDSDKIHYLAYIFGGLAFIPLLRPRVLLVALPIIAISLLSKTGNHSGLFYHYTTGLIAPLTIAFAEGLPIARKIWARLTLPKASFAPLLLICLLAIHIKMAPSPISHVFWGNKSWSYSYQAYIPTDRDNMIKEAISMHVPSNPTVSVSVQNTLMWGYLAHRKHNFVYPDGVLQPSHISQGFNIPIEGLWKFIRTREMTTEKTDGIWADYAVLDFKRPWFLLDKGCRWKKGACQNDENFVSQFLELFRQVKERFETVFENDGFIILKRKTLS